MYADRRVPVGDPHRLGDRAAVAEAHDELVHSSTRRRRRGRELHVAGRASTVPAVSSRPASRARRWAAEARRYAAGMCLSPSTRSDADRPASSAGSGRGAPARPSGSPRPPTPAPPGCRAGRRHGASLGQIAAAGVRRRRTACDSGRRGSGPTRRRRCRSARSGRPSGPSGRSPTRCWSTARLGGRRRSRPRAWRRSCGRGRAGRPDRRGRPGWSVSHGARRRRRSREPSENSTS